MIETTIKGYLDQELKTIPVLFELPKTKPSKYVIIHEIDAGMTDHIRANTFEFIIGAESFYDARVLCGEVRTLLDSATSLSTISSAKIGGEHSGYNATNDRYEYTLIFNFYHYEED